MEVKPYTMPPSVQVTAQTELDQCDFTLTAKT